MYYLLQWKELLEWINCAVRSGGGQKYFLYQRHTDVSRLVGQGHREPRQHPASKEELVALTSLRLAGFNKKYVLTGPIPLELGTCVNLTNLHLFALIKGMF